MLRLIKRHQTPLVLLLAILVPLFVYRAHARRPSDANLLDQLILLATAPLSRAMRASVGGVSDVWSGYVALVGAREEAGALRRRVGELEREVSRLQLLAVENAELSGALALKTLNPDVPLVAARVIGAGSSPSSRTLELDRGSLDGVARGQVVLAGEGLVGLVQRVGWKSAEVVLIADEKMAVQAMDARTRMRGWVRGLGLEGGFQLKLTEVPRAEDLRPGDRVVTSGLGGVFPRGIPIGVVLGVRVEPGVQHRVVDLEPAVDFGRVESVLVLAAPPSSTPLETPEALLPASLKGGAEDRPHAAGAEAQDPPDAGAADTGASSADDAAGVARPSRDAGVARPSRDAGVVATDGGRGEGR